jgi:5-methylcytosine-specific restriction enzyme A
VVRSVCATYRTECPAGVLNYEACVPYPFKPGERYLRKEVLSVLGLADPRGGPWYTGYVSHAGDFFIFCNVGTSGRTGHDYDNRWEETELVWYAKGNTHVAQSEIQRLLSGKHDTYLFWREDNQDPFMFAGLAQPIRVATTSPVRVRWRINAPDPQASATPPNHQQIT